MHNSILKLLKQNHGENLETAHEMESFSDLMEKLKQYNDALILRQTIVNIYSNKFGKEYSATIFAECMLAKTLYHLKNYNESLKIQEKAINWFNNIDINERLKPFFIETLKDIINTLNALGRHEETQKYLDKITELNNGSKDKTIE